MRTTKVVLLCTTCTVVATRTILLVYPGEMICMNNWVKVMVVRTAESYSTTVVWTQQHEHSHRRKVLVPPRTTVPAPDRHVSLAENQPTCRTRERKKVVLAALWFRAQLRPEIGHPPVSRAGAPPSADGRLAPKNQARGTLDGNVGYAACPPPAKLRFINLI